MRWTEEDLKEAQEERENPNWEKYGNPKHYTLDEVNKRIEDLQEELKYFCKVKDQGTYCKKGKDILKKLKEEEKTPSDHPFNNPSQPFTVGLFHD